MKIEKNQTLTKFILNQLRKCDYWNNKPLHRIQGLLCEGHVCVAYNQPTQSHEGPDAGYDLIIDNKKVDVKLSIDNRNWRIYRADTSPADYYLLCYQDDDYYYTLGTITPEQVVKTGMPFVDKEGNKYYIIHHSNECIKEDTL